MQDVHFLPSKQLALIVQLEILVPHAMMVSTFSGENALPVTRAAKPALIALQISVFPVWMGICLTLPLRHAILALHPARHAKPRPQPVQPVWTSTLLIALATLASKLTVNWTNQLLSPYSVILHAPPALVKA